MQLTEAICAQSNWIQVKGKFLEESVEKGFHRMQHEPCCSERSYKRSGTGDYTRMAKQNTKCHAYLMRTV